MPADAYPDRPWGPGDNRKKGVCTHLVDHPEFTVNHDLDPRSETAKALPTNVRVIG